MEIPSVTIHLLTTLNQTHGPFQCLLQTLWVQSLTLAEMLAQLHAQYYLFHF